ncbi:MAG: DNA repair protein RadC [Oscillospiraceae bacterium]|jgi:DNA repair protein RadC|nr:DNA repair protein RadC [Oscillospiraceae bacterium]
MSGDIHSGHRNRLRETFLKNGIDSLHDHNILELLLFYAIPRADTNKLAHELMDRFGTLADVFDAPIEQLTAVPGVGENAASLIKLIPPVSRRYQISRTSFENIITSPSGAGEFLLPHFIGERDEVVYIACLDAKGKLLACKLLFRGNVNSAGVSVRKIVETAITFNASAVILAHNHPSGIALPSAEDRATTIRIRDALAAVDVALTDHIVVADDDFISMASNGVI